MNILSAIHHGIEAIKVGRSLRHVEAWKNAQAVSSLLVVLAALVRAFGVDLGIDDSTLAAAGVAIAALVNAYLVYATSKKVGLSAATPPVEAAATPPVEAPATPPVEAPASPAERRTKYHETVRNPAIPSATVGTIRQRYGVQLPDGPTDGVERRGRPSVEIVPASHGDVSRFRESDTGWNGR